MIQFSGFSCIVVPFSFTEPHILFEDTNVLTLLKKSKAQCLPRRLYSSLVSLGHSLSPPSKTVGLEMEVVKEDK